MTKEQRSRLGLARKKNKILVEKSASDIKKNQSDEFTKPADNNLKISRSVTEIYRDIFGSQGPSWSTQLDYFLKKGFEHDLNPGDRLFESLSTFLKYQNSNGMGPCHSFDLNEIVDQLKLLGDVQPRDLPSSEGRDERLFLEKRLFSRLPQKVNAAFNAPLPSIVLSNYSKYTKRAKKVASLLVSFKNVMTSYSSQFDVEDLTTKIHLLVHMDEAEFYEVDYIQFDAFVVLLEQLVRHEAVQISSSESRSRDKKLISLLLSTLALCEEKLECVVKVASCCSTHRDTPWSRRGLASRHEFFQQAAMEFGLTMACRERGLDQKIFNVAQFCHDCRCYYGFGVRVTASMAKNFAYTSDWGPNILKVAAEVANKKHHFQRQPWEQMQLSSAFASFVKKGFSDKSVFEVKNSFKVVNNINDNDNNNINNKPEGNNHCSAVLNNYKEGFYDKSHEVDDVAEAVNENSATSKKKSDILSGVLTPYLDFGAKIPCGGRHKTEGKGSLVEEGEVLEEVTVTTESVIEGSPAHEDEKGKQKEEVEEEEEEPRVLAAKVLERLRTKHIFSSFKSSFHDKTLEVNQEKNEHENEHKTLETHFD